MKVIANKTIGKFITEGNEYAVIEAAADNYILITNDGTAIGYLKSHFQLNMTPVEMIEYQIKIEMEGYSCGPDDPYTFELLRLLERIPYYKEYEQTYWGKKN